MVNYDLQVLSPFEFENLSRDLLQKKLGVVFESFTTGPDDGIDFRYAPGGTDKVIVQAKRYKDYVSLYRELTREVDKVRRLSPTRYILTTSIGLTPHQKLSIRQLFAPFILIEDDILGRDDLNNLLSLYPDVERSYYKLWISSTAILQKILHSGIFIQSTFELEEIRRQVRLYVPNDSFPKAIDILNEHRYIIISGIPGIGKTTLARMLVLYLLANGYEEFVYLSDSIDEGYRFFNPDKKQVFFFDDFLGSNFFDKGKMINQDNRIVRFIQQVKNSPNKVFIMTTREYILSVARNSLEAFRIHNIEIAKCILEVSSYTDTIKAQILYNHLYYADVPPDHLADLLNRHQYQKLVEHPNFNPRIIEAAMNSKCWKHCAPNEFAQTLHSYFDNPESVWLYIFENSLDRLSQYIMLIFLSISPHVFLSDLEAAVFAFLETNGFKSSIIVDAIQFNRVLRELEKTFIKTYKDDQNVITIAYQNPSIYDFLFNYLKDKNELIKNILRGAIFKVQFIQLFTGVAGKGFVRKIFLHKSLLDAYANSLIRQYDILTDCKTYKPEDYYKSNTIELFFYNTTYKTANPNLIDITFHKYAFLYIIYSDFAIHSSLLKEFVQHKFQSSIYMDSEGCMYYRRLLKDIGPQNLVFEERRVIECYLLQASSFEDIFQFASFGEMFSETFNEVIKTSATLARIKEIVEETTSKMIRSDLPTVYMNIIAMEKIYNISFEEILNSIDAKLNRDLYDSKNPVTNDKTKLSKPIEKKGVKGIDEKDIINNLFKSLIQKNARAEPD